jgi:hypothetical protein
LLHRVKEDLAAEEALPIEKRDKDSVSLFQSQIRFLENLIEERKNVQDEMDEVMKQEEMLLKPQEPVTARIRLSEADIIPRPENEAVKGLVELLKKHDLGSRPNPNLWLQPDDFIVMAKALRSMLKNDTENKLKELKKNKKENTPEKRQDITNDEGKILEEAIKGFKEYPADLKKRRDMFEKHSPEAFKRLSTTKNTKWVDDADTVDKTVSRVERILKEAVVEEKDVKQRSVKMLEKVKYTALEAFLKQELIGIGKIADIFADTPLERKLTERENVQEQHLRGEIEKTIKDIGEARGLLEDLKKTLPKEEGEMDRSQWEKPTDEKEAPYTGKPVKIDPFHSEEPLRKYQKDAEETPKEDSAEKIKNLEDTIAGLAKYTKKMLDHMRLYKEEPATATARILQEKVAYFSSLYSIMIGILWFRHKHLDKFADEPKVEIAEKMAIRKTVLHEISILTTKSIWDREGIRQSTGRIKNLLSKFSDLYLKSASYDGLGKEASVFPYAIVTALEPSHTALLPADEMHHAQQLVYKFQHGELPKKTKALAPIAQEDLDKLIKSLSETYRTESSPAKIEEMAKKKGIPNHQAADYLRKLRDGLARHGFREFMDKWDDVFYGINRKKKRTDLGNRPSHEYETMGEFVENHLPKLFELFPPVEDDEDKIPRAGIPTPQKLREEIESTFSRAKPAEMEEKVDYSELFNDVPMGMGGSEKAKGRHRKKVIKPPPPSAVFEEIKDQIVHLIKTQSAQKVVLSTLALYVIRLRKFLNSIKDEEHIEIDDVIDGFVSLLKHLYFQILKLNVEPSGRLMSLVRMNPSEKGPGEHKLEKRAGITFVGQPDIPIDSAKEAEELFDKLKDIYRWINHYITPDKVGVPPENLSTLTKKGIGKKYMPTGLIDWYQKLQEYESKGKSASADYMVFKVANNYAQVAEDISESELILS